jgi:hypothetical protein
VRRGQPLLVCTVGPYERPGYGQIVRQAVHTEQVYLALPRDQRSRQRSRDACEMATPNPPSPIAVEELHNDTQRALATTVNEMLTAGLRGDDALDRIVEDIQPSVLFHPNVRPYTKFYRQVKDIFLSLGVQVDSRRGYPIIKALACVYPEGELRDDALAYVSKGRTVTAQPQREASTTPYNDATNYAQRDSARTVGSLLSLYKDDSSKYGGTIKENFQEAFDKYSRVIDDLQIPSDRGLQILHNMLAGEALSFYSTIAMIVRRSETLINYSKRSSCPLRGKMLRDVNSTP